MASPAPPKPPYDDGPVDLFAPGAVRSQLDKILASPGLVNSAQLCRFLRHAVERALAGDQGSLKENLLGVEVFERGVRFDPRTDPVVRVEARRLRAKLDEYYLASGAGDEIRIQLPKGSYVPVFERAQPETPSAALPEPESPEAVPLPVARTWWPVAAAALLLAATAAAGVWWWRTPALPAGPASVAVLPFANVGADPETEYFADGLTDELIDILGHTEGLRVVSRSSVYQFKGRTGDARGIAKQLNANFLLEGSVRREGEQLRVTAQLVDARNGYQLWSDSMERGWTQVFAIQQEIASSIASKLRAHTVGDRPSRHTENIEAYNAYLKGRYHWNKRTVSGFQAAIAAFQQSLDKDPNYAPAWAGLGDSYCMLGFMNALPPLEIRGKAAEAVEHALKLDDHLADAYVVRGNIQAIYDWDWNAAQSSFRRALEIDPDSAEAHYGLSKTLASIGRLDEGFLEIKRAQQLDPLSLAVVMSVSWELGLAGRYKEADETYRSNLELDPNFVWNYILHAWSLEARNRYGDAIADLNKAAQLSGSSSMALGELAYALGHSGQKQEAGRLLAQLVEDSKKHYISPFDLSRAYEGLGRRDEAMAALARAADDRSPIMVFLKADPVFAPLHDDPRYQALMKRMGFD